MGTGRCGTVSLAQLLNAQRDVDIGHEELEFNLPYSGGEQLIAAYVRDLKQRKARVVGDVFSAYLPYCKQIVNRCEDVRFLCLQRDREETIASFLKKAGPANHWIQHDGRRWISDPWDRCFPSYDETDIEKAIGRYWDDYYELAEEFVRTLGDSFAIFPVSHLNSKQGQAELLAFGGIATPRLIKVWENRG